MNVVINQFLLVCDKFIPEMQLKQVLLSYGICGTFTKNKQGIQNYIYRI